MERGRNVSSSFVPWLRVLTVGWVVNTPTPHNRRLPNATSWRTERFSFRLTVVSIYIEFGWKFNLVQRVPLHGKFWQLLAGHLTNLKSIFTK